MVQISEGFDKIIPGKYCIYITTPKDAYSLREILSDTSLRFIANPHDLLFFDEADYAEDLWVKLCMSNTSPSSKKVLFELNNPFIDDVAYYDVLHQSVVDSNLSGDEHIFESRAILFRNPAYLISLLPGDTHYVYIKLNADGRKIHLPFSIKSIPVFIAETSRKDIQFGWYYGILSFLTLLYFYLAYIIRDRVFFYFALYMLCLLVTQLCTSGVAFAYIWPHTTYWSNRSIAFSMAMTTFTGLLFAQEFIPSSRFSRSIKRVFYTGMGISLLSALAALGTTPALSASAWIIYRFAPVIYVLLLVIGGYVLYRKFKSARLFVPGFIFATISIGYMSFYGYSKTSDNVFTNNIVIYAVLLKCILLSIAVLDRLKIFKEEKEKAQALVIEQLEELNSYKEKLNIELEYKIAEKSKELVEKQNEVKRALISGEEKERKRVAQELHDGMGSLLSTLRLNAESIDLRDKNLNEKEAVAYQNVLEMIDRACTELRTISHNMLPSGIEHFGLTATLQSLVKKINHTTDTRFLLQTVELETISKHETELHLYRIVMELINNVIKHARARQAIIQLIVRDNDIAMIVEDDGIGFDIRKSSYKGVGLISVNSRVDALNGKFQVDSSLNRGTTVTIEIPLSS